MFLNFADWTFSFQTMAELYGVLALILQDGLSLCTVAGEVYIPQCILWLEQLVKGSKQIIQLIINVGHKSTPFLLKIAALLDMSFVWNCATSFNKNEPWSFTSSSFDLAPLKCHILVINLILL
jgi:hypothetical protein